MPTRTVKILERSTPGVSDVDVMLRQLTALPVHDFASVARMVAVLEALALQLSEVDRLQLGRLMVSSGHSVTLTCRGR